jgi:hypothetical protein
MNIGSSTPLQQLTPLTERFSINDVRTLVAKQLRVDIEFVTSETHSRTISEPIYSIRNLVKGLAL